jgi:hypothetical protein
MSLTSKIPDRFKSSRLVEKADQVLLGLAHTRESIPVLLKQALTRIEKNPTDIVGRVGRSVLERAEVVRKQIIEKAEDGSGPGAVAARWVPDWLREVSFVESEGASDDVDSVTVVAESSVESSDEVQTAFDVESAQVEASVQAEAVNSKKPKKAPGQKAPKKKAPASKSAASKKNASPKSVSKKKS